MYCHVSQRIHTLFFPTTQFCELITRFSVHASGIEGKAYLPQLVTSACIAMFLRQFTLCSFRPHSFCELTTRFSVDVSGTEGKDYLPQLVSVLVVTLGSTVLLYISFKHYTKKTLSRHMEDEQEQQRLLELK